MRWTKHVSVSVWHIGAGLLWFPVMYLATTSPGLNVERINIASHPNFPHSQTLMAYTQKFQSLADAAICRVQGVLPEHVDGLLATGAIALDIRDKEEHDADHIAGSLNVSRGKLEINIEGVIPVLDTIILCCCNAHNRGALSFYTACRG